MCFATISLNANRAQEPITLLFCVEFIMIVYFILERKICANTFFPGRHPGDKECAIIYVTYACKRLKLF